MTQRIPLPVETVGLIKAIVNQDLRERHAAGFKQGSSGLALRIGEALGLSERTVRKIKERERRRDVPASRLIQPRDDMDPERLGKIRQHRIRLGDIEASWKPPTPIERARAARSKRGARG